jgi:hypothetical protein
VTSHKRIQHTTSPLRLPIKALRKLNATRSDKPSCMKVILCLASSQASTITSPTQSHTIHPRWAVQAGKLLYYIRYLGISSPATYTQLHRAGTFVDCSLQSRGKRSRRFAAEQSRNQPVGTKYSTPVTLPHPAMLNIYIFFVTLSSHQYCGDESAVFAICLGS